MTVELSRDGHVATLTVNRPEALNALNSELLSQFLEHLTELRNDDELRVLIVTGAGDRAFIVGADIAEMRDQAAAGAYRFSKLGHAVCEALETFPRPVIAVINGFALGGGCEIALACDIRLMSEDARIGQPEVGLGIPPGWGGTQRLPRVVGLGIANEMILSGRQVPAEEAGQIGLVNAVHPFKTLLDEGRKLADRIASNGPEAVARSKQLLNQSLSVPLQTGLELEAQSFALAFDGEEQTEGMTAFLERREPNYSRS